MPQSYERVFNFSAGPGVLPVEVMEQARDDMLNWQGSGMGVMEMSHRGKWFRGIAERAESDLRELMSIPAGYRILFLQGGASQQFSLVPMNLMRGGETATYAVTGAWGKKAVSAAKMVADVSTAFDGAETKYDRTPDLASLDRPTNESYFHLTLNETIQGVDYLSDPEIEGTVVCDMSSNIISRKMDVSKYDLIYAGAQKNCGPAGVTIVILKDELLERMNTDLPPMFSYREQVESGYMHNTPPCWAIYICGLVYRHWLDHGGIEAVEKRNETKASVLYSAIDGSDGFYRGHAVKQSRSRMNVPFVLTDADLTDGFLAEAADHGFVEMKGHRSVGGCRASIYNAFPPEGVDALTAFMADFRQRHG
ncbi:MAG: 3-phosphoserine/phosphohydroxythreonine transaminase [Armatimonadetes bacterium]|nr:3-phosphoserine/phosphohydroxythreonine transaminase [Armatimonadota bacterium]